MVWGQRAIAPTGRAIVYSDITDDAHCRGELTLCLSKEPVAYRHVLSVLDSDSPEYRLCRLGNLPFVASIYGNPDEDAEKEQLADWLIWDEPDSVEILRLESLLQQREGRVSQLIVLGQKAFDALQPHLADGVWRLSRNYSLTEDRFTPCISNLVRPLTPEDRPCVERAARTYEVARHHSTMRDFDKMAKGHTYKCWGAFVDDGLVGYVSTNPICAGVTEISWIFTAEPFRRRGIAAGLLTAACETAFSQGNAVGYHAGSAGDDLDRMVRSVGFQETLPTYRFIPIASRLQWLVGWGRHA